MRFVRNRLIIDKRFPKPLILLIPCEDAMKAQGIV